MEDGKAALTVGLVACCKMNAGWLPGFMGVGCVKASRGTKGVRKMGDGKGEQGREWRRKPVHSNNVLKWGCHAGCWI